MHLANVCSIRWINQNQIQKTKTQNNIVIFGIFHKKLYCYFVFFLTKIRLLLFIKTQHFSFSFFLICTVYSGNSKRLNSEQSLISEHFWSNWAIFL